jgi:hypothetical protein
MDMATEKQVPEEVKTSDFGCVNCLWYCVECRNGSKYQPAQSRIKPEIPSCADYVYYD